MQEKLEEEFKKLDKQKLQPRWTGRFILDLFFVSLNTQPSFRIHCAIKDIPKEWDFPFNKILIVSLGGFVVSTGLGKW